MMGLKEFFTIKMVYFRLYPQYSTIPLFQHSNCERSELSSLNFQVLFLTVGLSKDLKTTFPLTNFFVLNNSPSL